MADSKEYLEQGNEIAKVKFSRPGMEAVSYEWRVVYRVLQVRVIGVMSVDVGVYQ